jgi:menaquinone-dependent protoporphyrinogen oxidase
VFYGTTDGHTRKIAAALAEGLRSTGAVVDVVDARYPGRTRAADYQGVIVAASIHAGGYQASVRKWVTAHAAELATRPTAFVSVCLGVLEHNPKTDQALADMMEKFFVATGWRPTLRTIFPGALLYRQYNWIKRWIMRRIVAKAHGDTDTSRYYEYTDWAAVRAFGVEFAATTAGVVSRIAPETTPEALSIST